MFCGPMFGLITFFSLSFFSSSVFAQSDSTSSLSGYLQKQKKPNHSFYAHVRFEGMQYLTVLKESPDLTYSGFLSARASGTGSFDSIPWILEGYGYDASAGTFFSQGQSNFMVSELYASTKELQRFKGFVGRKKFVWSEMDNHWQMAMWQPTYAIDALRPEEQGLTGFFIDYKDQDFQMIGFASAIFIPSLGPEIKEEGGKLVSDSRWYRPPSNEFVFNNNVNSIYYKLDMPEYAKLILNPSAAMSVKYGDRQTGPWLLTSFGYKPLNNILLKRQNFKETSADKVDVTVSPAVTYHSIFSTDMGYRFGPTRVFFSYLEDHPKEVHPDQDWYIQKFNALKAYSANIDFSMSDIFSRTFYFHLGYLKTIGGDVVDIDSEGGKADQTLFDWRQRFTDAVSFNMEGRLMDVYSKPLMTKLHYLYDYDQKGSLLSAEFLYYPNNSLAWVVGTDLLGVQDETYRVSRFLNQFRANDRVYGGMTYVF